MVSGARLLGPLVLAAALPAWADGHHLEATGFTAGGHSDTFHTALAPGLAGHARDGFYSLEAGPVLATPFPMPLAKAIAAVQRRLEAEPLGSRHDRSVLQRLTHASDHLGAYYAGRTSRLLPALQQVRLALRFLDEAGEAAKPHIVTLVRGAELTTRVEINRLAAERGDDYGPIVAARQMHRQGRQDLAAGMYRQAADFFSDVNE